MPDHAPTCKRDPGFRHDVGLGLQGLADRCVLRVLRILLIVRESARMGSVSMRGRSVGGRSMGLVEIVRSRRLYVVRIGSAKPERRPSTFISSISEPAALHTDPAHSRPLCISALGATELRGNRTHARAIRMKPPSTIVACLGIYRTYDGPGTMPPCHACPATGPDRIQAIPSWPYVSLRYVTSSRSP